MKATNCTTYHGSRTVSNSRLSLTTSCDEASNRHQIAVFTKPPVYTPQSSTSSPAHTGCQEHHPEIQPAESAAHSPTASPRSIFSCWVSCEYATMSSIAWADLEPSITRPIAIPGITQRSGQGGLLTARSRNWTAEFGHRRRQHMLSDYERARSAKRVSTDIH